MISAFDHPWLGGLFGDDDAAALWAPSRTLAHMCACEAALTRAMGHVGRMDAGFAEAIAQTIETTPCDMADLRAGTARDGVVVPALVAQLRAAAGNDALHLGATSQDVIDTALSLTLRDMNDLLAARLTKVVAAVDQLTAAFGARHIMGRTRMQAAQPIRVSDRLAAWSAPLRRHQTRLANLRASVEQLQLGGAAGDRAALGPDGDAIAAHMAQALGLSNPPHAWHSTRDSLADYASLLSLITGSLGKLGQDICLMAQQGVDEITLTAGGTSSAMPHKKNPVLAELLVTLAHYNATQMSGLHHALLHEQERSGAAWMLEWLILPQMAQATARSLAATTQLCGQISDIGQAYSK